MIVLWCCIEGERDIYSVSISPTHTIIDLKNEIYNGSSSSRSFVGCGAKDLTLRKVRYIMISM